MKRFEIRMVVTSLVGLCFLAGLDVPVAHADLTFGEPVNLQSTFPLLDLANEAVDCFSADGLEMYIESNRAGGQGGYDLCVCKRTSPGDNWGPPQNLGPLVNSASEENTASITGDGLELYFASTRPGGYGMWDIHVVKRATRTSPWGPATNLGPKVNSPYWNCQPSVTSDGLELYLTSGPGRGGYGAADLYVSRRATASDPWGDAVNLGPAVNSPADDCYAWISPDGLLLVVQSNRPGGYGAYNLWMARRAGRTAPWQPAANLGPMVNAPGAGSPFLTPDGSALYFWRVSGSTITFWKAPILPTVDFNADGKVDLTDLVMLIDNWGSSKTLCDTGPMPWGDGKVDIEDLKVFMTYYEKANPPAKP